MLRQTLLCSLLLGFLAMPMVVTAALSDEIQVYTDDINDPGEFGLELHVNTTPKGRSEPDYPGEATPQHGLRLTPEISYGITKTLEAGLYIPMNRNADGQFSVAGAKLRLKWLPLRPEDGHAGWFAGANGELSRLQHKFSESRDGFEMRLMGGYRDPAWLVAVNAVFGWDLSPGYRGAPELSGSLKLARNLRDGLALGIEYYSGMGRVGDTLPLAQQDNVLYATIDMEQKGWSLNFGVGRGLTGVADKYTVKAIVGFGF